MVLGFRFHGLEFYGLGFQGFGVRAWAQDPNSSTIDEPETHTE